MNEKRIKILYIAGSPRSGSTILGNILNAYEGLFFGGELFNIWDYYLVKDRLCGCGLPASQCELWSTIFSEAFGDSREVDAQWMEDTGRFAIKRQHILEMVAPWRRNQFLSRLGSYPDNLEKLYRAILHVTGAKIIVESSKRPLYTYLLGLNPSVDLSIVHLIRDPRAVAHSWTRKKIQQEVDGQPIYMGQYGPMYTAVRWNIRNLVVEGLWQSRAEQYLRVRYEEFIARPQQSVLDILKMAGIETVQNPFVDSSTVRLTGNHTVRGNPNRFEAGDVKLRLDDEWKDRMSRFDRTRVSVLTWPLLLRYGYVGLRSN